MAATISTLNALFNLIRVRTTLPLHVVRVHVACINSCTEGPNVMGPELNTADKKSASIETFCS